MDFQRLLLVIIFAMSGMFLFQAWQRENAPPPPPAVVAAQEGTATGDLPAPGTSAPAPGTTPSDAPAASAGSIGSNGGSIPGQGNTPAPASAAELITVDTDLFTARINTQGGVLEDVALKEHRDGDDVSKPYQVLVRNNDRLHIAQSGFLTGSGLPNHATLYSKEPGPTELGSGEQLQVRLTAPNAEGGSTELIYTFRRDSYVIDLEYVVHNGGSAPLRPTAYFQLQRDTKLAAPEHGMMSIFHGPALYTEDTKYKKIDYKDIEKGKRDLYPAQNSSGWIGMVEHYFVNAWLPRDGQSREFYTNKIDGADRYVSGLKVPLAEIAPGATGRLSMPLYTGPQEQDRLNAAATGLQRTVDYGMFNFIAAPMFVLLKWFHALVGNWGWAIVLLTILIKGVFYPLNAAAGRSMGKMKLVAPKLKELQTTYANDRAKLNQAMMELYRKEKINPLGGCLPILIQIPVFIALYWVLIGAVELRHAPWIGWIKDLSAPDPFFVLPVLYAVTALLQTRLQPPAPGMDPIQQKMLQYMPVAFAVMFIFFPAGLVLYWTVSNILQIAQQWRINSVLEREQQLALEKSKR